MTRGAAGTKPLITRRLEDLASRASGFLNPALRSSSNLGFGLKVPYFITLGPHKDLRITPYLTTKGARSVELRYRQAFAKCRAESASNPDHRAYPYRGSQHIGHSRRVFFRVL